MLTRIYYDVAIREIIEAVLGIWSYWEGFLVLNIPFLMLLPPKTNKSATNNVTYF